MQAQDFSCAPFPLVNVIKPNYVILFRPTMVEIGFLSSDYLFVKDNFLCFITVLRVSL